MATENKRICTACGQKMPAVEENCLNCGTYMGAVEQEPADETSAEDQEDGDLPLSALESPSSGVTCPHCGKTHPPGSRFCPFTRRRIFKTQTCRHCGNKLQVNWVGCPHCGQPLRKEDVESKVLQGVNPIVQIACLGLRLVLWMVGVELIIGVNLLFLGSLFTTQIIQMVVTNTEWRFEEQSVGQESALTAAQITEGITHAADQYYPGELADVETLLIPPDRITVKAWANGTQLSFTLDINLVGNRPMLGFQDVNGIPLPIIGDVLVGGINRGFARVLDKARRQIGEMRVESDQIIVVLGYVQEEASKTTSTITMTPQTIALGIGATRVPSSTNTLTLTPTNISTPTSTNIPVCNAGTTVQGIADNVDLSYIDILQVSTMLEGNKFTAVFHLREIPDEITINLEETSPGRPEIGWGISIDVDNDPDTGWASFITDTGYGYDKILQAVYPKQAGGERTGKIQNLFKFHTFVWDVNSDDRSLRNGTNGTITVDEESKTLTISANIQEMTDDSHLNFYSFHRESGEYVIDELCVRRW